MSSNELSFRLDEAERLDGWLEINPRDNTAEDVRRADIAIEAACRIKPVSAVDRARQVRLALRRDLELPDWMAAVLRSADV